MSDSINNISYLQIFRIYYSLDPSGTSFSLFNNGRQMIPVTVEILARDSNDKQVPLSTTELNSIRLARVDSAGGTIAILPHGTSPGSAAWHTRNANQGYTYDHRAVGDLSSVVTRPAPVHRGPGEILLTEPDSAEPIISGGETPDAAQYVTLWVATTATSGVTLAAIFQGYSSATAAGSRPTSTLDIVPKSLDISQLTIRREGYMASGSQGDYIRTWNEHLPLFSTRMQRKLPIKNVQSKIGVWWDRGEAWKAEYSMGYLVSPGVSSADWSQWNVPYYIHNNQGSGKYVAGDIIKPGGSSIENPRPDEVILCMTHDPHHRQFYWDKSYTTRASDKKAETGVLVDTYGNFIPIRIAYTADNHYIIMNFAPSNPALSTPETPAEDAKTVNELRIRLSSGPRLWTNGRQQVQVEIEVGVSDAAGNPTTLSETERANLRVVVSRYGYRGEENTDDNEHVIVPDIFRPYDEFGEWQASENHNGYREYPDNGRADHGSVKREYFDYYLACRTDGGTTRMRVCALLTLDTGERYCTNGLTWDADGSESSNNFGSEAELIRVPVPSLSEVSLEVAKLNGDNPGGEYTHFRNLSLQYLRTGAADIRRISLHADTPGMIQWNYPDPDPTNAAATYTAYASPGDAVFSVSPDLPPEAKKTKPELPAGQKGKAVVALCGRTDIPYRSSYDRLRGPCDLILEDMYGNIWLCQMNFEGKTGEAGREEVTFTLTAPRY